MQNSPAHIFSVYISHW